MITKTKFKLFFCSALVLHLAFAQFTNVNVDVDARQLKGSTDKYLLEDLKNQITNYLGITVFAPDAIDLELRISMHIVVEDIIDEGAERIVKAQAVVTNGLDQQLFAKGVDFPYSQGQSLVFSPIYEPLAAFVDYYAFMIIAGELDTYDLLGGSNYYTKALEISENGRSSMYSRGWDVRWKKSKELIEITELREAKLYFYMALDIMLTPGAKKRDLQIQLDLLIDKIEEVDEYYGADRNAIIFLKPHAIEIGNMLAVMGNEDGLYMFKDFDRENQDDYQEGYDDFDN